MTLTYQLLYDDRFEIVAPQTDMVITWPICKKKSIAI